jgi:hypothetical protein
MPGYERTWRSLINGDFGTAWNALDLYAAKDARAFLEPKMKRLFPDDPDRQEQGLQIALGFACMAVHAEREEQERLQHLERATEARRVAPSEPEPDDEEEIEELRW